MDNTEIIHQPEYDTVVIDNLRYPVTGTVAVQDLAAFERKATIGDYTKDSDDLISALVLSDFSGGGQIEVANESSDSGRYWWGDLYTQAPGLVTLNRETIKTDRADGLPPSTAWFLGTIAVDGVISTFGVFGTAIHTWSELSLSWLLTDASLTSPPTGPATIFQPIGGDEKIYIPLSKGGFDVFDGETVTHDAGPAVAFHEWDKKLFVVTMSGELLSSTDGVTFTAAGGSPGANQLPARAKPLGMVEFFDRSGEPDLNVVTNRRLYAWDPDIPRFYPTDLAFPAHPNNGLASATWRNSLYVSAGLEVYQYTGSTLSAIGPIRDHGLPAEFGGRIVSMCPEHNGLYALVEGRQRPVAAPEGAGMHDPGQLSSGDHDVSALNSPSSLLVYTERGWHVVWMDDSPAALPTHVAIDDVVSGTSGRGYRLWWGSGGHLYSQLLSVDFHNPRQGMALGDQRFALHGSLTTSWYDFNMPAFKKIFSHVHVMNEQDNHAAKIDVYFQLEYQTEWQYLGTATGKETVTLGFGPPLDPPPIHGGPSEGVASSRIRFRLDMTTTDPAVSPILVAFVVKYIKVPLSTRTWRFSVPLDFDGKMYGRTANEMARELDALLIANQFASFVHGPLRAEGEAGAKAYRVRVSQVTGTEETGLRASGIRHVSLVEVPIVNPVFAGQVPVEW